MKSATRRSIRWAQAGLLTNAVLVLGAEDDFFVYPGGLETTADTYRKGQTVTVTVHGIDMSLARDKVAKILAGAGGSSSQNQRAHETAATVLSWPAGTWLVGVAGAVVIGVGLWNLYRGLSRKFEDKWRTGEMGATARKWGGRVGTYGHVARAVVFGLIGVFVIRAALQYDPKEAIGLDGALQKLASAAYGPYLLGLTAAGLIAYGLYCLVDARYRDVSAG